MKTRVISGAILTAILASVFIFAGTPFVIGAFASLLSVCAVYETLSVTKYSETKLLTAVALFISLVLPLIPDFIKICPVSVSLGEAVASGLFFYVFILFLFYITSGGKFRTERMGTVFFISLIIPVFFMTLVLCNRKSGDILNLIMIFIASWGCDTGGYCFGRMFGRKKLAPVLSPKKTVEGAIGGVATSLCGMFILAYVASLFREGLEINLIPLIIIGIFGATVGIFGDLFASSIKRNFGVKDYSNLIPGHGGIMDRFDSVLFVAPFTYFILSIIPVFN